MLSFMCHTIKRFRLFVEGLTNLRSSGLKGGVRGATKAGTLMGGPEGCLTGNYLNFISSKGRAGILAS